MKTQFYTACSLDGFLATPDDSVDWLMPLGKDVDTGYNDFIKDVGAVVMGSATYEWMLRHTTDMVEQLGSAWPYTQPTWVFTSRTLQPVAGADIRFVRGDVRPVYDAMRAAANGKNIWIVGGGELAAQFADAGLLDEIIVTFASVTLGKGKPLFPRLHTSPPLEATSVRLLSSELVEIRYHIPQAQ